MNRERLGKELKNIVITVKKRGPKGKFRSAKSETAYDFIFNMEPVMIETKPYKWYHRLFMLPRYRDFVRQEVFNTGALMQRYTYAKQVTEMVEKNDKK